MISDAGRSKRCGARQLLGEHGREVAGVEEAGLRVDARLLLELRHVQRAVDQEQRRERERDQRRVHSQKAATPIAEGGEHELGREHRRREQPGLARPVAAGKVEHPRHERCG